MRASSTPRVTKNSSSKRGHFGKWKGDSQLLFWDNRWKSGCLRQTLLHQALSQLCPFSFKFHPYDLKLRSVLKQNSLRINNTTIYFPSDSHWSINQSLATNFDKSLCSENAVGGAWINVMENTQWPGERNFTYVVILTRVGPDLTVIQFKSWTGARKGALVII